MTSLHEEYNIYKNQFERIIPRRNFQQELREKIQQTCEKKRKFACHFSEKKNRLGNCCDVWNRKKKLDFNIVSKLISWQMAGDEND